MGVKSATSFCLQFIYPSALRRRTWPRFRDNLLPFRAVCNNPLLRSVPALLEIAAWAVLTSVGPALPAGLGNFLELPENALGENFTFPSPKKEPPMQHPVQHKKCRA